MCTYITCTTLMQIIDKHSNRVQPMDNASPLHMPHHTSPSPQYISAHCQVNLHVNFKRFISVHTSEKRNTIAWCDPGEKASHHFFVFFKKGLVMCSTKSSIQMFHSQRWFQKKENKINYKALKWTMIFDHICWHETNFSVIKNMHNPCALIWRKYKSTSLKRYMTLHCNFNKFLPRNNLLFALQIKVIE